jgi:hypothetical protein
MERRRIIRDCSKDCDYCQGTVLRVYHSNVRRGSGVVGRSWREFCSLVRWEGLVQGVSPLLTLLIDVSIMASMSGSDYKTILDDAFTKLGLAVMQRNNIEIEIVKLKQFIHATMNMLSLEDRVKFRKRAEELLRQEETNSSSLVAAIRQLLQGMPVNKWLTVSEVRDRLIGNGFDFRGYTSEPLASVSTTLKRIKPEEVETKLIEGVTAYRWKGVRRFSRLAEAFHNAGRLNKSRYGGRYGDHKPVKEDT